MHNFRLISRLQDSLVVTAYECTTERDAQRILKLAHEKQRTQPPRLTAGRSFIVGSPDNESNIKLSDLEGDDDGRWRRHVLMPHHSRRSISTVLALSGRAIFNPSKRYRNLQERGRAHRWVHSLSEQPADCYIVWQHPNGAQHIPVMRAVHENAAPTEPGHQDLISGHPLHGVAFARRYQYNRLGEPKSFIDLILQVHLFFDSHRECMRFELRRRRVESRLSDTSDDVVPGSDLVTADWQPLVQSAYQGFRETCRPERAEAAARRKFLIDTIDAEDADDALPSGGFAKLIEALNLQEALDRVKEPWQLAPIVERYGPSFVTNRRRTTYAEVVDSLLAAFQGSGERRLTLRSYVDNYLRVVEQEYHKTFYVV